MLLMLLVSQVIEDLYMKGNDYDYLVDTEGRIFIVVGHSHPHLRTRVRLVYIPAISKEGKSYNKVIYNPTYPDVYVPITYYYSQYDKDDKYLAIPDVNVVKVYEPRRGLRCRIQDMPREIVQFIKLLTDIADIPQESIGIFGSWLVGLEHYNSDVDLVIYGRKNYLKFNKYLDKLIIAADLSPISNISIRDRAQEFTNLLQLPLSDVLNVLQKRRTKYAAGNTPVSISFSHESDDIQALSIGYPQKSINILAAVIDDSEASFTPRTYRVKSEKDIYTIVANHYFFKEVASLGDHVIVRGTLREGNIITIDNRGEFILPSRYHNQ